MLKSDKTIEELSFADWWAMFPGSYLCAMLPKEGQAEGCIPSDELPAGCTEEQAFEFMQKYVQMNQGGWNIHFTPNGVKVKEDKNKLLNFANVNAFFVDIDIPMTNDVKSEADLVVRAELKNDILSDIFIKKVPLPTLTIETRNGFQLYWVIKGIVTEEDFNMIQRALVKEYKADPACSKLTSMLRVPYFKYYKKGETGIIKPVQLFCSMCMYTQAEILEHLDIQPVEVERERVFISVPTYKTNKSMWQKVTDLPVDQVIEKLSGTDAVRGDVFTLKRTSPDKLNIIANGATTPNWLDLEKNMIFSNNQPRFCNIFHFLKWYGLTPGETKEYIKTLFKL
jgi:hypothetical protein